MDLYVVQYQKTIKMKIKYRVNISKMKTIISHKWILNCNCTSYSNKHYLMKLKTWNSSNFTKNARFVNVIYWYHLSSIVVANFLIVKYVYKNGLIDTTNALFVVL